MTHTIKFHPDSYFKYLTITFAKDSYWQWLAPFISLLLIEFITFGSNAKGMGIYQDEWITFSQLHFVPHSLAQLVSICFWNPRIIIRPLEALHFGLLFYLVKENPFWYHFVCYIWEFIGSWFLFLALNKFVGRKKIAFIAALLYLLYPTHDVTHYEIVASSLPMSMAFFTISLWLYLKGLKESHFSLIYFSALTYFLSIYNYELCLPLIVLYPLLYLFERGKDFSTYEGFIAFIVFQIPAALVLISMLFYRWWLLPHLGLGYNYATVFDLRNFVSVLEAGWTVSFSPFTFQFLMSMLWQELSQGLSIRSIVLLALGASAIFFYFLTKTPIYEDVRADKKLFYLIIVGMITITFSYTIYGLSPEHKPVIDAWLNRVNLGGALGASMIIAGLFGLLENILITTSEQYKKIIFAFLISFFACALILINWQFAKPWIISWNTQKSLMNLIQRHAKEINSGDSIIIGNIIRYTSKWAPVVDGIWDFQGLVRTTLNNEKVNGTVVTERLSMTKNGLIDKYGNILLGSFPFNQMIICDPLNKGWARISSRKEFIQYSRKFGWSVPEALSPN